ncbi:MAG: hypothetical protein J5908_07525 [Selenomonas sp.]|nr:hypothetical protein [Selenomonas ruminantium]MBO5651321.1 hypothetical protein [Selenomonas sp.]
MFDTQRQLNGIKARGAGDVFPQLLTSLSMAKEKYYQPRGRLVTTM